ncbi:glycosyltransferase [Haloarcula marismortui]|uniref:glycosyltransferase n=1 Tax=Haloarcula marismortui TaxID=2238 RepID=UPI003C73ABC4
MKISLVTPQQEGPSSLYSYTDQLIKEDEFKEGLDIDLCTFKQGSINPLEYLKVAQHATGSDSKVVHIQHEYGVFGPATIMSWVFFPMLWILASIRNKSIVITVHEVINNELIRGRLKILKKIYIHLNNHVIGWTADYLIFLSSPAKFQFKEFTHGTPVNQIAHGASTERQVDLSKSEAKSQFGFDPDTTLIAEFGYISERKGSDFFVDLAKQLPKYEFLLAGGPEKGNTKFVSQLKERCPKNLQITGELESKEFHASFIASDVVVLPYREDTGRGFVNEVKQSGILNWCMTYELPVITSDCKYFCDLEEEYGCLRTYDSGSMSAAITALEDVMQSESKKCDLITGTQKFKKDNMMSKVCNQHINIYRQLMCDDL